MSEIKEFWEEQHEKHEIRYLSDYSGEDVWKYLMIEPYLVSNANVLNIGVGTGRCTWHLKESGVNVYALDISEKALENVKPFVEGSWLTSEYDKMPSDFFDVAISHLVIQHMTDDAVLEQLKGVLRSLKQTGIFAFQHASPYPNDDLLYNESLEYQKAGAIIRTREHIKELIVNSGGEIIKEGKKVSYDNEYEKCSWNSCIVRRRL